MKQTLVMAAASIRLRYNPLPILDGAEVPNPLHVSNQLLGLPSKSDGNVALPWQSEVTSEGSTLSPKEKSSISEICALFLVDWRPG